MDKLLRDMDAFLMDTVVYMDMIDNCNTEDLLILLEAEILIYNMEDTNG